MIDSLIRKLESAVALSHASRQTLQDLCSKTRQVEARRYILREGDAPHGVPVVLSGWAARYKLLAGGSRQITAFLIPGDHCDRDMALLHEIDHSIMALAPCQIAYIPSERLKEATEADPDLARAFAWCTLVDEAILRAWVVNVGRREGYERLAHLMCEMHMRMSILDLVEKDRFGAEHLDFPVTQEELADTVGLTPVHTNRVLQRLRSEGVIRFGNRRLTIFDVKALRQIAGFSPNYLHVQRTATPAERVLELA